MKLVDIEMYEKEGWVLTRLNPQTMNEEFVRLDELPEVECEEAVGEFMEMFRRLP